VNIYIYISFSNVSSTSIVLTKVNYHLSLVTHQKEHDYKEWEPYIFLSFFSSFLPIKIR
jgi:hypothetical protein